MITIDEMEEMLDQIASGIPKEFYYQLNGGILLLPEAKLSPHARADDLWILGEYARDYSMGRYISIFYGSFMKIHGRASKKVIYEQLKETLLHEFTHHMESLAGERGLEIWDQEQLEKYLGPDSSSKEKS